MQRHRPGGAPRTWTLLKKKIGIKDLFTATLLVTLSSSLIGSKENQISSLTWIAMSQRCLSVCPVLHHHTAASMRT